MWKIFKQLVSTIIVPATDVENNAKSPSTPSNVDLTKENRKSSCSTESSSPSTVSTHVKQSLFPAKPNIDENLTLGESTLSNSAVVPCSLDISNTPMSLSLDPQGVITCNLNNNNNNNNILPLSPESNNSPPQLKDSQTPTKEEDEETDDGPFICHYCDAKFRIRGYLTRHIKKHAVEKAYHCPFFNSDILSESRCHNTGGFSRRDTYKTHLKARHFVYPKGMKPQDRAKSSGHCSQCGQSFTTADDWIKNHIESGDCHGLPEGYLQNIKTGRKKKGKLKMIKTSTGHSRFISTAQSVVDPKILTNKEALEAMVIVAHDTNRNDILSKYGNNKIMMNSEDFQGQPKSKRKSKATHNKKNATTSPNSTGTSIATDNSPLHNPLAAQDIHLLESIPSSTSSLSSNDSLNFSSFNNKPVSTSISTTDELEDYIMPLDMEQCPYNPRDYMEKTPSEFKNINDDSFISANTLNNDSTTLNPTLISETHLKETKQYLNFYNYSFGTKL